MSPPCFELSSIAVPHGSGFLKSLVHRPPECPRTPSRSARDLRHHRDQHLTFVIFEVDQGRCFAAANPPNRRLGEPRRRVSRAVRRLHPPAHPATAPRLGRPPPGPRPPA